MAMIAMAGLSMLSGMGQASRQAKLQKAQADADRIIGEANTYAQNLQRQQQVAAANTQRLINNGMSAVNASIQNKQRSMGNQLRLTQLGNKSNDLQVNMARTADRMVRGNIEQRISAAEQMGALVAANAGRGGGSAAAMASALNIQQSRARAYADQDQAEQTYDMKAQAAGLVSDMYLSLDLNQSIANIDYAQDVFTPSIPPIVPGDFAPSVGQSVAQSATGALLNMGMALLPTLSGGGGSSSFSFTGPSADAYSAISGGTGGISPTYGVAAGGTPGTGGFAFSFK